MVVLSAIGLGFLFTIFAVLFYFAIAEIGIWFTGLFKNFDIGMLVYVMLCGTISFSILFYFLLRG